MLHLRIIVFLRYLGFFAYYAKARLKVKGYVQYMDAVVPFTATMEEIKNMLHFS